jgi:hypothetical protein
MTKAKTTNGRDLIQIHWRTICYEIRDQNMSGGLKDFEVLELDQSPEADRYTASVQFSAATSKEIAIESLQLIIEKIEVNGLPETTWKMPREYGAGLTKMQKLLDEASDIAEELHPDLRNWYRSLLEHADEPGFSEYLKKFCEKLGISEDDAEEGDNDE